jgi:hypothetical protein
MISKPNSRERDAEVADVAKGGRSLVKQACESHVNSHASLHPQSTNKAK